MLTTLEYRWLIRFAYHNIFAVRLIIVSATAHYKLLNASAYMNVKLILVKIPHSYIDDILLGWVCARIPEMNRI